MKKITFLFLILFYSAFCAAGDNNLTTDVVIQNVYVHDCCGRKPYVAVILNKHVVDPTGCSAATNYVAAPISSPLAAHLLSVALTAQATGKHVHIWTKDSCAAVGDINEWVGIQLLN